MAHQYTKRPGTSGMLGQLYETKLLSLIYFRAIHDDSIEEFYLAANLNQLGSFDDICFRAKFKEIPKPLVVFIQAIHKEKKNSVLTLNKSDLAEYFKSYLKIKFKFKHNNEDVMFKGEYSETDCFFVLYTTAKGDNKVSSYKGTLAKQLNALIRTGDPGAQPLHGAGDEEFLCKVILEEQMAALARLMAKCFFGELKDIQMQMQDELMLRYHVILAQKFFVVSEIKSEGHRDVSFRDDFFDINKDYLRIFRDELCTEILKRRKHDKSKEYHPWLFSLYYFGKITDPEILYKEFGNGFSYKNGKFVILDKNTPDHYKEFLDKINVSRENIRKAIEVAIKECLPVRTCKVPAWFGNKDLTLSGKSDTEVKRKLNDLTLQIVNFIDKSKPKKVVTIDDSFGKGFLQLSGGIASAVGNLLIFDESSELFKFNDNYESLGNLGKQLYCILKEKIPNFKEYRFHVHAKVFPKLSIETDEYNRDIVNDFLNRLLFYTSQSSEKGLQETLIYEINNSHGDDVQHVEVTTDAIFRKYHDEIQKWSASTEAKGIYLDKEGILYKHVVKHAISRPLISVINIMQRIKTKNHTFRKDAVESIKFEIDDLVSGTVVITENIALTVTKVLKLLNNKNTVVLDFEYILNLSRRDEKTLRAELMDKKKVKTLIVVFNSAFIDATSNVKLEGIANSMKDHTVIIITDQNSLNDAKKYFSPTGSVIKDEIKLIDMSEESQKRILENTKVKFQDIEVSLGEILIKDTINYVEEDVLNKMLHSKTTIGKPFSNPNYNSKLYIQRHLRKFKRNVKHQPTTEPSEEQENVYRKQIRTLDAIEDNNVIVFGDPGIGKSTLLTHLSLNTRESWTEMGWIVRINLIEHTAQFSKWKDKNTYINDYTALKFLCKVAISGEISKTNLKIDLVQFIDGTAYPLGSEGDEWSLFELKMFLYFYNNRRLIILFDGFDEICPTYANEVLSLIKAVKSFYFKQRMWITSRSYGKMHSILENLKFGTLFHVEPLNLRDQDLYLTTFWDDKEILKNLNEDQFKNMHDCVTFVSGSNYVALTLLSKQLTDEIKKDMPLFLIGLCLVKYLRTHLSSAPSSVMKIINETFESCFKQPNILFENEYVPTPLHLNIMADYLYNTIMETNTKKREWEWNSNMLYIYEYYLENKLKIHIQEKSKNDMLKPDNILACEREYEDSLKKHKKLAAYAAYYRSRTQLFTRDELIQITNIISTLMEGEESTGIICKVVDEIPLFVHSTFKEYLVVEYICDLIKTQVNQNKVWDFILNVMFFGNMNVLATLDAKINIDKDLLPLFRNEKNIIFNLLLKQGKERKDGDIKSSISQAIRYNIRNLAHFFIFDTLKDNLNETNFMNFIEIVIETKILLLAAKMEYDNIIAAIVNHVRRIDRSKVRMLFGNMELNEDISELHIEEIIRKLHVHVWERMDTIPEYKNLKDLCNQIYFI